MTYKLVIFDFDGTLADTGAWFVRAANRAAARFGFRQLEHQDFTALRSRGNREIIAHLGVPVWKLPMIAAFMRRQAEANAGEIRLFHGIEHMLHALHAQGLQLAVVSSNSEKVIRSALGEHARLFDHFGCGASLFGKARHFRQVLKRASLEPGQVLAIGDEARDIEAARSVGIAAGSVAWGYAAPEFLRSLGPDLLFAEIGDITAALSEATV